MFYNSYHYGRLKILEKRGRMVKATGPQFPGKGSISASLISPGAVSTAQGGSIHRTNIRIPIATVSRCEYKV